jgi:hypothetical protein
MNYLSIRIIIWIFSIGAIAILLLLTITLVWGLLNQFLFPLRGDKLEVWRVCDSAITAEKTIELPPSNYRMRANQTSFLGYMLNRANRTLDKYYVGNILQKKSEMAQKEIETAINGSDRVRVIDEGVKSISYDKVFVHGDTATVTAQAMEWQKLEVRVSKGQVLAYSLQNNENFSFTLQKDAKRWFINNEVGAPTDIGAINAGNSIISSPLSQFEHSV